MISDKQHIQEIAEWLESRNRLLITGHQRPDGDCLGSILALGMALSAAGKTCRLAVSDPVPHIYHFLPGMETLGTISRIDTEFDGVITLECGSASRTGIKGIESLSSLNIDHHASTEPWADLNWINPEFAAVGEMILLLLDEMGLEISADIAGNLFAAVMTDTGSFQYSNTTAGTFMAASRLVSRGADPAEISRAVYMNQKVSRLKLLARVLETMEIDSSGRIASIRMTLEDLEATGAEGDDTEGFVNYPLSVQGIEASVFLRQAGEHLYRISLRSKQKIDVSQVAVRFGGGGHARASGFSLESQSLQEARELVLSELRALL